MNLTNILTKYALKKKVIFKKTKKKAAKSCSLNTLISLPKMPETIDKYWYYQIWKETGKIAKTLSRLEKRITRIEKILNKP